MRLWIVLPAYNEAENIPAIFTDLRNFAADTYNLDLRVIVVDDGSSDETVSVAKSSAADLKVELLQNPTNYGLAYTFMRGMMAAVENADDRDIIVCMDADNSHIPGQLTQMVRAIQEGRDVIIASRFQHGAVVRGVPLSRRLLSWGMSGIFRTVFPIKGVRDYSCGYRAYRASFLKRVLSSQGDSFFPDNGFACMVSTLLRLHKQDAVFGEVPIVLRYDQKRGLSKMRVLQTIVRTLKVLVQERFSSSGFKQ